MKKLKIRNKLQPKQSLLTVLGKEISPELVRKLREELGNGHAAWLEAQGLEWEFIREVGKAWEEVIADQGSTALVDTVRRWRNPSLIPATEICKAMKADFDRLGFDPLVADFQSTPWFWVAYYLVAIRVADTWLHGDPSPTEAEMRNLVEVGATSFHTIYSNYNAWVHGSQTFSITLPLASKLLLTDISKIQWKDFRLPFPSFVIQIPPSLAKLHDNRTGDHDLDTIIVVDGSHCDMRRVEFFFMARENANSIAPGDDATVFANITCPDEEDTVEASMFRMDPSQAFPAGHKLATVADKRGEEALHQLIRFACSVIMYLASHPDDRRRETNSEVRDLHNIIGRSKSKRKAKAKARLRELLARPRPMIVGTKVTIDPNLEKIARAIGRGSASPPSVASYVRGHHKMQAYGPNWSLRKPIWIEPYWKNLNNGPKTQKTYTVK